MYVKYRMLDHALGHIDPLFVRDPNHVAALELQVWLLGELGRGLEAANALVRLGEILMASDPTTARAYVERAQKSVPNHIRAELVLAALDASGQNSVGTTPKAPSWADELTSVLAELEADNGIEELEVDEDIDEPSMAAPRRGSGRPPVRSPGTGRAPHASLQRPVRPDDAAVTKVLEVTVPAVPHSTAHTVEQAIHLKPASEPGLTWPDIADELDELRFFITGRFGDDAQFAYLELQRRFPGHPALTEFAERFTLGARLESAAAPVMLADVASAAPPVMPEIGAAPATVFPLEDEDEDSFLASIFDEPVAAPVGGKIAPRRAVATLDDGADAQTFFDLGTAYREMGLIDDALTQFDLAARDHRWTSRARVMMASLGVGRGENDQALADLQTAIDSATDQDEQSEARYELGVLYQALGDTERAISALEAVSAGYRDRDDRLRKILGLITPTQSHNPSPEATALSSNINDPSEPDTRYLEVALPRQLVERKAYPLHVLIRMPGTPTLLARLEDKGVVEKKKFAGGTSEVLVNHPVGPRGEREPISILVWMRSSDFLCPKPCKQMLLYHRRETLSLTFSVTPCVVGTVSLVVEVQIEGDIVGSEPVSRVCVEGTSVRPTQDSTSPSNPGPPPHRPPLVPPKKKLKILMVSASPDDQVRLRVDKEFRDIVARLERTFARDLLQIEQLHAATLADLRTALLRHEPHVLHLSCHGEINGDIVLEGKEQGGQRVVKADILRLLRALRDNLCLVFLNACHSHVLASEVPPNIDLAIGMTDEITDAAAMDIAVAFYETLAYGRTVETAFDTALVGLSSLAQAHIPVLFPPAENDPGKKRSIRLIRA